MTVVKIQRDALMRVRNALASALTRDCDVDAIRAEQIALKRHLSDARPRNLPQGWTKIHEGDLANARHGLESAITETPDLGLIRQAADFLSDHLAITRPFGTAGPPAIESVDTPTRESMSLHSALIDVTSEVQHAMDTGARLEGDESHEKPQRVTETHLRPGQDGYAAQEQASLQAAADQALNKQRERIKKESWPQFMARRKREGAKMPQIQAEWKVLKEEPQDS